ncbi:hypothetical protein CXF85_12425 [Colwellia sp. 75C3]|uniref:PEP-CTERM sorting domain-containing protein n=1 Tax=Colwellia sp. 75C3 TaxID=888425 RepID=UPI000C32F0C5|nr:PEP-CTERM sorting domain-containing protein [Colwellia sp. 75C3]PKG82731.1 hypothetical protein CXF85_12425 [Colwellia sp. 75C3]
MKKLRTLLIALPLTALLSNTAFAGLISEDFNSGSVNGATLYGPSVVVNNELQLTSSNPSLLGGMSFSDQDNGQLIKSWGADFDFRIDGNSNGGADGISLTYSRLGEVGVASEEGLFSGLAIGFDTWNNDETSGNHISLRYDGVLLVEQHISAPSLQDGVVHNTAITMDEGLVSVSLDGTSIFTHQVANWSAYSGQFNFGARTGWAMSRQVVDNFNANTVAVPEPSMLALFGLALFGLARRKTIKK